MFCLPIMTIVHILSIGHAPRLLVRMNVLGNTIHGMVELWLSLKMVLFFILYEVWLLSLLLQVVNVLLMGMRVVVIAILVIVRSQLLLRMLQVLTTLLTLLFLQLRLLLLLQLKVFPRSSARGCLHLLSFRNIPRCTCCKIPYSL